LPKLESIKASFISIEDLSSYAWAGRCILNLVIKVPRLTPPHLSAGPMSPPLVSVRKRNSWVETKQNGMGGHVDARNSRGSIM